MDKLSGYIEVEMGGKVRPIKFGMGAWKIFTEVTGLPLDRLGEVDTVTFPAAIIYAGCKQAALGLNEPIDFNLANVYDWIDVMPQERFNEIAKTLSESKVMGRTFKDIVAESIKKKTVPTK